MNQVLNGIFAAYESPLAPTNDTASAPAASSANHFPYAEAIIAGIRRADLLDNLAAEPPSTAQAGQFARWLRGRGALASNS
ncbi:hypothetical protein [Hymenobacter cavernae]|uniref:Uncharacterized protein n=1 Tax=Hymenobacter cavernae TaxID=2044852 RepID=A0ABQ1UMU0_9BACT|nr:hypothetical protein [Hymenobacter cavernae]GGF22855.1 hypothetical protein GCM10011383_38170 [Hymenobacter cavernae]